MLTARQIFRCNEVWHHIAAKCVVITAQTLRASDFCQHKTFCHVATEVCVFIVAVAFFSRMLAGVNLLKYIDASLVAICLPNDRCYRLVAPSCSPGFSQKPGRALRCVSTCHSVHHCKLPWMFASLAESSSAADLFSLYDCDRTKV